jgi:ABC-type sugar transport system permease subunit
VREASEESASSGLLPVAMQPPGRRLPFAGRRAAALTLDSFYVIPVVVLVGGLILVPAGIAVVHSFTDWHPGGTSPFVGIRNFVDLAQSPFFRQILVNEGIFLLGIPVWTIAPLVLALLLYERVALPGLFRTIFFFPSILSPAIVGIMFRGLLAPDGLVNATLQSLGLGFLARSWIDSSSLVKPVLIVLLAWAGLGVGVVIFSAALSAIPVELFEAAEIDGASFWQRLRHVMLPGIRGTIVLWVVFQLLSVFLFLFAWIYVLTAGGPGFSSTTLDYDIFQNSMNFGFFGTAAAESVYLLGIVLAIVLVGWLLVRWHRERDR